MFDDRHKIREQSIISIPNQSFLIENHLFSLNFWQASQILFLLQMTVLLQ